MVYSLLYVSKTLLELPAAEAEVAKIVEVANSRNGKLGVTGALVSSGSHFAQVLEGDQQAVEELMRSINDDARHMRIRIIRTAEEPRRFPGWSMAYSGFASFVGRRIAPFYSPLQESDQAHLAMRLIGLMEGFTRMLSD